MTIGTKIRSAACESLGARALRRSWMVTSAAVWLAASACGSAEPCCEPPVLGVVQLSVASGDEQVGPVGAALSASIGVLQRSSTTGPMAGETVQWTAQAGATVLPTSSVTGSDGVATTTVTPTAVGVIRVQASSPASLTPAVFTAFGVPAGAAVVRVGNNFFEPTSVSIARGGSVAWVWRGSSSNHNVVPVNGTEPTSSGGPQGGPALYTHTFGSAGSYRYRCTPHSGMEGTVVVN